VFWRGYRRDEYRRTALSDLPRQPVEVNLPRYFDATVEYDDGHEVLVRVTPGHPAVMYLPNGDPGYPADPPEVEVLAYDGNPRHARADELADDDDFYDYVVDRVLYDK